jgi:hypothetical protein
MRARVICPIAAALCAVVAAPAAAQEPAPDATCPVTIPNGVSPAGPRPNWHGSRRLATGLPADGILRAQTPRRGLHWPGRLHRDGSVSQKFLWLGTRHGAKRLRVRGRRLDAPAPPLRSRISQHLAPKLWPSGLIFPTTGCWRVKARAGSARISFVLLVVALP